MICGLVGWGIFGLFVGAIARLLWPRSQPLGCAMTMLLGVAGSVVGGMLTYFLTGGPDGFYQPAGYIMSVVGAVVLLWLFSSNRHLR